MATEFDAEEPCTVCGHALGWHKHADACRFEDCDCRCYDGVPAPVYSEEPIDFADPDDRLGGGYARDTSVSRCGNWPASIGEMGTRGERWWKP